MPAAGAQQALDQLKTAPIQTRPIPGHLAARTCSCACRTCVGRVRSTPGGLLDDALPAGWCLCTCHARPRATLRARYPRISARGIKPRTARWMLIGTTDPRGCRGIASRMPVQGADARSVLATCPARANYDDCSGVPPDICRIVPRA